MSGSRLVKIFWSSIGVALVLETLLLLNKIKQWDISLDMCYICNSLVKFCLTIALLLYMILFLQSSGGLFKGEKE